jgi:protein-disulfide isomerase/uncharacterized membrane protein
MKKNNSHPEKSRSKPQRSNQRPAPASPPASQDAPVSAASMRFSLGALFLLVAIGASVILALDHFDLTRAPGCGPQSGCDLATRGPWGKIPGLNWPLSLVGVAFFTALLAGWISSRGVTTSAFRGFAMLGAVGSLFFLGVMIVGGYLCKYCLATHLANFAFVAVALWSPRVEVVGAARAQKREFVSALAAFVIATAALAIVNWQTADIRLKRDEAEFKRTVGDIITKSSDTAPGANDGSQDSAVHSPSGGFTGRWLQGPQNAPIRLVIFGDFQCEDCYDIEVQVRQIMERRTDVSLSAKHFPMNMECNPYMPRTLHQNACWAARASEAAGILKGNEGFWEMHHVLFDRRGAFTDAEIQALVTEMGYDWQQFRSVMMGPETAQRVKEDVDEGRALGLFFTPMIFINGVELRGFINANGVNPTALIRAVDQVAASNPRPGSPLDDRPPLAPMKGVGDWLSEPERPMPARAPQAPELSRGPDAARVTVWIWNDFQSPSALELDRAIQEMLQRRKDVRVVFRQYPMDQSCNSAMRQTISRYGCWAARAAEAAANLGGQEGYWRMHQWLFNNQSQFNDAALRAAAPSLGLNADELLREMNSQRVQAAIAFDAASGRNLIVRGIPTVYVNGKWVSRWKIGDANVLDLIIKHALGE